MMLKKLWIIPLLIVSIACSNKEMGQNKKEIFSAEEEAKRLVSLMTLDEKVSQMNYESPAIEHLDIPAYNWWNECLHGVARSGLATVFPQAIGMAAMWDRDQMFRIADAISDEARAKHHAYAAQGKRGIYQGLTFWTPNINIFRDPRWGRGMETYGEDPFLTGELGVQFIKGLQGDDPNYYKLIATAKHFVVHSGPELDRHRFDARPSVHDMINTYSPHFKKVVQEAGVYSVMCAYNSYNGLPCCGNSELNDLLRKDWGFKGYIVSDCWAINDFYNPDAHNITESQQEAAAMAVKAGTDLNCGNSYPALKEAVKNGYITEEELDVSVERLILARLKLGLFAPKDAVKYAAIPYDVVDSEKHRLLALEAARKSIVLLKNEAQILPLSKSLKKIAVIGSNADDLEVLLGNYNGYPSSPITPLKGIQNKLPNAEVSYAAGCKLADGLPLFESIPGSVLFTDKTLKANGLKASYFANEALEGEPAIERIDKDVNFIWRTESPGTGLNNDVFSVKWTGYLSVPESGSYALGGEAFSGMKLYLNDTLIVSREDVHHPRKEYEYVSLKAGEAYKIDLEYKQKNTDYAIMRLLWEKPDEHLQNEALKIAKEADVVIMCMGLSPLLEGEEMKVKVDGFSGGDREHTDLPLSQISLMKKIKELGKPMVLVLLNGSAVSVNWENENIPAIIEAWYPGQAGGTAIADVLFGDYNPAGRLPLTFYKSINDIPEFSDYDMKGKTYRYFEGKPLYEFGYGLSYSKFAYKNFEIPSQINTDQKIEVSVDVINTGEFDGDEVTQLYVIRKEGHVNNPKKTLVGFQRNYLKKGETKKVKFTINALQLAQVNETLQQVVSAGDIEISVGGMQASEKSLREKAVIKKQVKIIGQDFKIN